MNSNEPDTGSALLEDARQDHMDGDLDAARAGYERVIALGHPATVPRAAMNLGRLLAEQDDPEGASKEYQPAIDGGRIPPSLMMIKSESASAATPLLANDDSTSHLYERESDNLSSLAY